MKVTITQPTRHDGKHLAAGDVADLPKAAALALIACGAAEEGGTLKRTAASDAAAKAEAEAQAAALAAAEQAVVDAQAQLDAAADEAAKDAAAQELDNATAALAALKA